jgi:hypothetical protein
LTTYYVRAGAGNNANNGTSPATAWATRAKVFGHGVSSPVVGSDVVYFGGGTYRETTLISSGNAANFPQPTSTVQIIGDVDGSHTGDAGEVIWTNFLTNDNSAATTTVTLDFNSRGNLTFDSISIISGSSSQALQSAGGVANCANVTFKRCFIPSFSSGILLLTCATDTNMNWLFEKCILWGASAFLSLTCPTSTIADYTTGFTVRNCLCITPSAVNILSLTGSGAGSFKPGGVAIYDCTCVGGASHVKTNTAGGFSTTIPLTVYNCTFYAGSLTACLNAATSGQIVEDYNYFESGSPRTNVTAGANSKAGNVLYPSIHFGQELLYGFIGRPFAMPTIGSPLLGFGKSGSVTSPADDLLGRARPEGGSSTSNAIGAFERHDTAIQETTTVRTGSNAINITGPGSHEFQVPVNAASTTLSIYGRYDTTHATTNKPQMMVVNGGQCGVSDATATMTAAADTWEQLSLTFTPTAKGFVTVRLISRSAGATGKAFWDDFSGGASGTQGLDYFRRAEPIGALVAGSSSSAVFNPIGSQFIKGGY